MTPDYTVPQLKKWPIEHGSSSSSKFELPRKRIHTSADIAAWLRSRAQSDVMTFLLQLNTSMFSGAARSSSSASSDACDAITKLRDLLVRLESFIRDAPPDSGPRRFGNVSFRKWMEIVQHNLPGLLRHQLCSTVLAYSSGEEGGGGISAVDELQSYLVGSFGSPQRLDYGTGHELSFLAFLAGIWKLNGFESLAQHDDIGWRIVLEVLDPYFKLVRNLITTYNLEPAGSHGVWGLDDHSFLPYIFGSAQLSPVIDISTNAVPKEGSAPGAPKPSDVIRKEIVDDWKDRNLYFAAVGFINQVKKGPFWEHSPILYDISGITTGWAKINKGMLKMYYAEVLSKFPVVQHFHFGSLFPWETDPDASSVQSSVHMHAQLGKQSEHPHSIKSSSQHASAFPVSGTCMPSGIPTTVAPWTRANHVLPQPRGRPNQMSPAKVNESTEATKLPVTGSGLAR